MHQCLSPHSAPARRHRACRCCCRRCRPCWRAHPSPTPPPLPPGQAEAPGSCRGSSRPVNGSRGRIAAPWARPGGCPACRLESTAPCKQQPQPFQSRTRFQHSVRQKAAHTRRTCGRQAQSGSPLLAGGGTTTGTRKGGLYWLWLARRAAWAPAVPSSNQGAPAAPAQVPRPPPRQSTWCSTAPGTRAPPAAPAGTGKYVGT